MPVRDGRSADRGLAYIGGREGLLVAYAAEAGNVAKDGVGGNGPYARALAEAMRQNKPVLAQLDYVADAVSDETKNRQNPTREGNLRADAYLLPEKADTLQRQHDADWRLCETSLSVIPCDSYRKKHPQGLHFEQAGIRIADILKREATTPVPVVLPSAVPVTQAPAVAFAPGQVVKDCDVCPEMVMILGGSFMMGDAASSRKDEKPVHRVTVRSFMLGKTEVTQAQWQAIMGDNPSYFKDCGGNCPVEHVSWDDAQAFIKKLNARTGKTYRLPSEAEWEYAARAGSDGQWGFGNDEKQLGHYAWYWENADRKTHPVVLKEKNSFGLYDMHGNVWEWVADCYHDSYNGAPNDGSAWVKGCQKDILRVLRGGSWGGNPVNLRSASRYYDAPTYRSFIGLRVAWTPP